MAEQGCVISINSSEEWEAKLVEAIHNGTVVIVEFSAIWCVPYQYIAPVFVELSKKFPHITFLKVDMDDVQEVAEKCKVSAMPTFQVYRNGEKLEDLVGANRDRLEELVSKYA